MNSREVGLVLGAMLGKHLLNTDDLHYGYWPENLEVCLANLHVAQEHHSRRILECIPPGVRTVLDIGCGAGAMAQRLQSAGYQVEGVSPSGLLTERATALLGEKLRVHECRFEDFVPERTYDLALFSESFQYVHMPTALDLIIRCVATGGHLLICDLFRKDTQTRGPIGGGHRLSVFRSLVEAYPLTLLLDEDITRWTGSNYDLVEAFLADVGRPARDLLFRYGETNYPLLTRVLKRIYRRKLEKLDAKYFRGLRTSEAFATYKTYRLMLWRHSTGTDTAPVQLPACGSTGA